MFKKLGHSLLENRRFSSYLLYALGEIVLIVIGILFALQLDALSNRRSERRQAARLYATIQRQLQEDRKELENVRAYNLYFSAAYERANEIIALRDYQQTDSLAILAMMLSQYSDFHRSARIYENLAASGQLGLLDNAEITGSLQKLEMTFSIADNLESLHWDLIINELSPELRTVVNYNTLKAEQPERLYGLALQNIFVESIYLTKIKDSIYNRALHEIDGLNGMIASEIESD